MFEADSPVRGRPTTFMIRKHLLQKSSLMYERLSRMLSILLFRSGVGGERSTGGERSAEGTSSAQQTTSEGRDDD